jgi:hypothetical protein
VGRLPELSSQSSASTFRFAAGPQQRFFSTPVPGMTAQEGEDWKAAGILDERGLVIFDNLHEMQKRSCQVFAKANLFATYSEESSNFEWMTFEECKSSRNLRIYDMHRI